MLGDFMALYHLDKICRREASQGGLGKVRIGGEKVFRGSVQVGEVAPAPTGDQDLFADAAGMFNQEDTLPSPACMNSTEKPRRAGAHDQNIVRQSGERGLRQLGVISYQTCPYYDLNGPVFARRARLISYGKLPRRASPSTSGGIPLRARRFAPALPGSQSVF